MIEEAMTRKTLSPITRIVSFIIGLALASYMFIFSFQYEDFPHTVSVIGYDLTGWILIAGLVLLTIFAGWLIKVGITGRRAFD